MENYIINLLLTNSIIKDEDIPIYKYAIFVVFFNLICVSLYLIVGILTNKLTDTFIFLVFYAPIRVIIGGFHCKTPLRCLCFTSTSYYLLVLLSNKIYFSNYSFPILLLLTLSVAHFLLNNIYHNRSTCLYLCLIFVIEYLLYVYNPHLNTSILSSWIMCSFLYLIA